MNTTHILVRHKVSDYAKWKAAYDTHAPSRKAASLTEIQHLRNIADPNEVILLFSASDPEKAKAFGDSTELHDVMKKAGVVGWPEMFFLNQA